MRSIALNGALGDKFARPSAHLHSFSFVGLMDEIILMFADVTLRGGSTTLPQRGLNVSG